MADFELIVGLLLVAVVLSAIARRVGAPYPAFLALGGVLLAFIPGGPKIALRPDLALLLFVAPVLLDAAYDASPRDLKENWAPLAGLVVVAVGLTTFCVAWVARTYEPTMPWAVAVALGAIVAPPDAAAATAVLSQVSPPHRIVTILQGESLLNDATALLIYRVAIAVVVTHGLSFGIVAPAFLLAVVGSLVAGPLLARFYLRVTEGMRDVPSNIVLQFVGTFGVWIFAERLGLSSVLTMVSYALALSRRASERTPARLRVPSYAVWDTVVFVVNVLAFMLIGLQIRPIILDLEATTRARYFHVAGAVLFTVIAVRLAWVLTYSALDGLKIRRFGFHPPRPMLPPTTKGGLIVAWCGMRGVVTLAAALALPTDAKGAPFPFRDLIVLTAFCVVLGTLVVQGLTLKPLLRWLDVHDDDPVGREIALGRARVLGAAMASLESETSSAADAVRHEYADLFETTAEGPVNPSPAESAHGELHRRALSAARHVVSEMRAKAEIGDDAYHRLEEDLDRIEFSATR